MNTVLFDFKNNLRIFNKKIFSLEKKGIEKLINKKEILG